MSLYKKIIPGTDKYEKLSVAVPYGGHLSKTKLRPPLYEAEPDLFILGNDLEEISKLIRKNLNNEKSVMFHLRINGNETYTRRARAVISESLSDIDTIEKCICLPHTCTVYEVNYSNVEYLTPIFDFSDSNISQLKTNNSNQKLINDFESGFIKEKMVWFGGNLPNSIISPIWSKRVITPSKIIRAVL